MQVTLPLPLPLPLPVPLPLPLPLPLTLTLTLALALTLARYPLFFRQLCTLLPESRPEHPQLCLLADQVAAINAEVNGKVSSPRCLTPYSALASALIRYY